MSLDSGVPVLLVPDNPRALIRDPQGYEPLVNRTYEALAEHYACAFDLLDRPALRRLPLTPFEYAEFKRARVSRLEYHVECAGHYYSVPHVLVGQEVELRVTRNAVEVLFRHQRVASHVRSYRRGGYTTVAEHMPASHRAHREWTPTRLLHWAATIGPATASLVTHLLESKAHPELGYRACLGLLALARKYGDTRLEAGCARALAVGAKTRKSVAAILAAGLDRQVAPTRFDDAVLPAHANVRGPEYYH